ncbi:MAG: cytochrome c [Candidatus Eisenbacteria bacterium]|nr:cytochrome c [Candidatus Eisenbacteria bacterium]
MSVTAQKLVVALLSLALVAALVAAGSVDARRQAEARKHAEAMLDDAAQPQIARGRAVYTKYSCNACHAAGGTGGIMNLNAESGGKVNGLLHLSESYRPAELAEKIRNGVPTVGKGDPTGPDPPLHMPPYRDLIAGQEMRDLVAYLMSLRPPPGEAKSSAW